MKAMIFAAGLGTRLKPFTLTHPKALVPVGGKPMLEHIITRLRDHAGITSMVVNVHHFADQIRQFLADNHNFGIDIKISDETDLLLDTGGGILNARHLLMTMGQPDEPILVHNADILTDFHIDEMLHEHNRTKATATLLVQQRDTSRYLLFSDNMMMRGWTNISTHQLRPHTLTRHFADTCIKYAFGGVHIISPSIFDLLQLYNRGIDTETNNRGTSKFSIMDFYIHNCTMTPIRGFAPTGYTWYDVGRPDTLDQARQWLTELGAES